MSFYADGFEPKRRSVTRSARACLALPYVSDSSDGIWLHQDEQRAARSNSGFDECLKKIPLANTATQLIENNTFFRAEEEEARMATNQVLKETRTHETVSIPRRA